EDDGCARHSAGLDDEKESPTVEESDDWVVSIAQVSILSAHARSQRGELGVNKCANQRDHSADQPGAEHEERRMNVAREDRWGQENSRADNSAPYAHRGVE